MTGDDLASWCRAIAVALALAQPACAAAPRAESESPRVAIGIAAFEAVGAGAAESGDVAVLLAERIAARGVASVAGPAQLGAVANAEPTPEQVQAWAAAAGVATIAVGQSTLSGERRTLDVRLRAGRSGGLVARYFAEAATPADLGPVLDRLAGQIVDGTVEWLTSDVAAAPVRGGALRARGDPFAMDSFDSDQPISIHSDELEATQNEGARRLVFSKRVRVEQGDLRLTSARLEAFYPANASQPDRLVATGNVRVMQGTREARCDEAIYYRVDDLLVCEGHAELRDGEDRVGGERIEFDLTAERVRVKGGASVLLHPESETPAPAKPLEQAESDAVVAPPAVSP